MPEEDRAGGGPGTGKGGGGEREAPVVRGGKREADRLERDRDGVDGACEGAAGSETAGGGARERERETERQADRQIDRQTDRDSDRQKGGAPGCSGDGCWWLRGRHPPPPKSASAIAEHGFDQASQSIGLIGAGPGAMREVEKTLGHQRRAPILRASDAARSEPKTSPSTRTGGQSEPERRHRGGLPGARLPGRLRPRPRVLAAEHAVSVARSCERRGAHALARAAKSDSVGPSKQDLVL
eukprot:3220212-Rhodomonas_salina.2